MPEQQPWKWKNYALNFKMHVNEASALGGDDPAEEKIQALSVQNARLREALIRLRD
jgi:hypothetical protein